MVVPTFTVTQGTPISTPKSQSDDRWDANWPDQFGRRWLVTVDKKSGDLCGFDGPSGWSDPLQTPPKYVRLKLNGLTGRPEHGAVGVRVEEWMDETRQDEQEYLRHVSRVNMELRKIGRPLAELLADPDIMANAGPGPWPSTDILRRAFVDKDPELLGLVPLTARSRALLDPDGSRGIRPAAELFPTDPDPAVEAAEAPAGDEGDPSDVDYKEFVAHGRKMGMSMQEIGERWQARKAAQTAEE